MLADIAAYIVWVIYIVCLLRWVMSPQVDRIMRGNDGVRVAAVIFAITLATLVGIFAASGL